MCKKFEINMLKSSGDTTSFNVLSHNAHAYSMAFIALKHEGASRPRAEGKKCHASRVRVI